MFGVGKKVHMSEVRSAMRVECSRRANVKEILRKERHTRWRAGFSPFTRERLNVFPNISMYFVP